MSEATTAPERSGPAAVTSKDAWKARAAHTITCPSGAQVKIRVLNLPALMKSGAIPTDLLSLAKANVSGVEKVTDEMVEALPDFQSYITAAAVVEPALQQDEVAEFVPYEDVELIVDIATRQRDVDSVGHQIGGLETVEDWRRFRGLPSRDSDLEDLEGVE